MSGAGFHDRFRTLAVLGSGGTGTVLEVCPVDDPKRRLAAKVLAPTLRADPVARQRLYRELQLALQLDHPGLPRIDEVVEDVEYGPVLLMERLYGEALATRTSRGLLAAAQVKQLGLSLLEVIAHVHEAGILHRDVTPANVFLARDGDRVRVVLLDLGLAGGRERVLTQTGDVQLTPGFAAPELHLGLDQASVSSDLYAVGATLLRCRSVVRLPMDTSLERLRASLSASGLEPQWLDWFARCCHPDPAQRFTSAEEMRQALQGLPGDPAPLQLQQARVAVPPPSPRGRAPVAVALALLGVVGVSITVRGPSRPVPLQGACIELAGLLLEGQRPDGSFAGIPQAPSSGWDTAQHLVALERAQCHTAPLALERGHQALARLQVDGGWGAWSDGVVVPNAVATSWGLLARAALDAPTPDSTRLLLEMQRGDGGFAWSTGEPQSHPYASVMAVWALSRAQGVPRERLERGAAHLVSSWRQDGVLRTTPGLSEQTGWTLLHAGVTLPAPMPQELSTALLDACDWDGARCQLAPWTRAEVLYPSPSGTQRPLEMQWLPWAVQLADGLLQEDDLSGATKRELQAMLDWGRTHLASPQNSASAPPYAQSESLLAIGALREAPSSR